MVAKAIETLGFDLGSRLLPAAPDNPKGFNEDASIFEVNELLLDTGGLRWDLPSVLPMELSDRGDARRLLRRANSILARKLQESRQIVVKDPRFSILLPIWLKLARANSARAQVVITLRHPLDVADSLYTRDGLSTDYELRLWGSHYYALIQSILDAELSPQVVSYRHLLADPRNELDRLAGGLGVAPDPKRSKVLRAFERDYLDTSLCHSVAEQGSDVDDASLTASDRALFALLLDASTSRWSSDRALEWMRRFPAAEEEVANALVARKRLLSLLKAQTLETAAARAKAEGQNAVELELRKNQELITLERRKNLELLELEKRKNAEFLDEQTHAKETALRDRMELEKAQEQISSLQTALTDGQQQLNALEARAQLIKHELDAARKALRNDTAALSEISADIRAQLMMVADVLDRSGLLDPDDPDAYEAIVALKEASARGDAASSEQSLERSVLELQALSTHATATQRKTIQALIRTARGARQSHREVERHLTGALTTIQELRRSLSYRLGRAATLPIRLVYDLVYVPASRFPFAAFWQLLALVIRHPIYSIRQINRTRLRNAWITFFRKPASAKAVVSFYDLADGAASTRIGETAVMTVPERSMDFTCKVSIFTVNYNGQQHLAPLLDSIAAQRLRDGEVIIVDNGSQDGSIELLRARYPQIKTIALSDNLGFAEANNIAAEVATGRYWCLLNNDMVVDPNWLDALVDVLEAQPDTAAVGPKIRFWKPFIELHFHSGSQSQTLLDIGRLMNSLPVYAKVFFVDGWSEEFEEDGARIRGFTGQASLRIPLCEGQSRFEVRLRCSDTASTDCRIETAGGIELLALTATAGNWSVSQVDLPESLAEEAQYLINNAGSLVDQEGNAADRGFGEVDQGQYDRAEPVTALCGGAMLLRPECLGGLPLFCGAMFAYFEDTDLSLRLRQAGYKLMYCGRAVVYHKHASTSTENSAFFRFYVTRNRLLFTALHFPQRLGPLERQSRDELRHLARYYQASGTSEERRFADRVPELVRDWDRLLPLVANGALYARQNHFPRIAVYNNFWKSLGGGEKHAAAMASVLQRFAPVDLISEMDFEVAELERCFGLDLKYCRKRLLSPEVLHHSDLTRQYDLFINSTFGSDLCSLARRSFYVVSFPYPLTDRKRDAHLFLSHYHGFWANSVFTQGWIQRWWNIEADVLYPVAGLSAQELDISNKEKLILHVGRFFLSGHNKKQLELVNAFRNLYERGAISAGWRFVMVGQVHADQQGYVDAVSAAAEGLPVSLLHNVSRDELDQLYRRAAIYWHATGLNEELEESPELFEHFGITTIEAMAHGCIPIVIDAGGQPEIVNSTDIGYLFTNEAELKQATARCTTLYEDDPAAFSKMAERAAGRAADFALANFQAHLLELLEQAQAIPTASVKLL
ncbi:MAG: glycosyltransferase [Chromatiaceae bacterium]|nr:glycosyltransferase [Chromatiaceae bacterium]